MSIPVLRNETKHLINLTLNRSAGVNKDMLSRDIQFYSILFLKLIAHKKKFQN